MILMDSPNVRHSDFAKPHVISKRTWHFIVITFESQIRHHIPASYWKETKMAEVNFRSYRQQGLMEKDGGRIHSFLEQACAQLPRYHNVWLKLYKKLYGERTHWQWHRFNYMHMQTRNKNTSQEERVVFVGWVSYTLSSPKKTFFCGTNGFLVTR